MGMWWSCSGRRAIRDGHVNVPGFPGRFLAIFRGVCPWIPWIPGFLSLDSGIDFGAMAYLVEEFWIRQFVERSIGITAHELA
jgi:hypothetical protein